MSRSRAIETRLEKLIPSLDEYFSSGFLTKEEVMEVSRQRTHWEYRLVAKPLLILDVRNAIKFELQLEDKLRRYCAASKLNLRNRWTVLERIEGVYRIGLKNLRVAAEKEALRKECVQFHKQFGRVASLGKLYADWMMFYPTRSDIWIEAAEWAAMDDKNVENGRALIQQALLTMAGEPSVWASALKIELHVCVRLLNGLLDTHRAEVKRKQEEKKITNSSKKKVHPESDAIAEYEYKYEEIGKRLREENSSMGSILLDLALAKTVVEEAFNSPANGPALIRLLVSTASAFPISLEVVHSLRSEAVERCFNAEGYTAAQRELWEGAAASFIWDLLSTEHFVVNEVSVPLTTPEKFLECGGALVKPSLNSRLQAASRSLFSTAVVLKEMHLHPQAFSSFLSRVKGFGTKLTEGAAKILSFLQRAGVEQALLSEMTSRLLINDATHSFSETFLSERLGLLQGTQQKKNSPHPIWRSAAQLGERLIEEFRSTRASASRKTKQEDLPSSSILTVGSFSSLLSAKDAQDVTRSSLSAASSRLDSEGIDRLLMWWKSVDQLDREKERPDPNSKEMRRTAVVRLFLQHKLFASSSGLALTNKSAKRGGDEEDAMMKKIDLRCRPYFVSYLEEKTPIALWRLFNALEVMSGLGDDNVAAREEDSSSDDEEETGNNKRQWRKMDTSLTLHPRVSCYAVAGLNFLAGVSKGTLNTTEEWEAVEGICSLVRSRFYSVTGMTRFKPAELSALMQQRGPTLVQHITYFLKEIRRCRPFPRYVLVSILIPFYEALISTAPNDMELLKEARSLFEELISLYGLSQHLDHYPPLLYDGQKRNGKAKISACQPDLPKELNAQDWMRFISFERFVTKDLTAAQRIMERARRLCLAPQHLLIVNHSVNESRKAAGSFQQPSFYESI